MQYLVHLRNQKNMKQTSFSSPEKYEETTTSAITQPSNITAAHTQHSTKPMYVYSHKIGLNHSTTVDLCSPQYSHKIDLTDHRETLPARLHKGKH